MEEQKDLPKPLKDLPKSDLDLPLPEKEIPAQTGLASQGQALEGYGRKNILKSRFSRFCYTFFPNRISSRRICFRKKSNK